MKLAVTWPLLRYTRTSPITAGQSVARQKRLVGSITPMPGTRRTPAATVAASATAAGREKAQRRRWRIAFETQPGMSSGGHGASVSTATRGTDARRRRRVGA